MSKKEIWKPVKITGKKPSVIYMISNLGRLGVKDEKGKVEVRKVKAQRGGNRYNYRVDGKSKSVFIHKEVARAFVAKPSPKHLLVIRKDHNYYNDEAANLSWVTKHQHRSHVLLSPKSLQSRKRKAIVKSPTAKVFDEQSIKEVKRLIWDKNRTLTFKQIAKKFRVSEMQIYRIKSGEIWYHVRVAGEPERKRYKQNLSNIAWHKKNGTLRRRAA